MNPSQNALILDHLRAGRTITALESLTLYGCLRLSGRILELRRAGHPISAQMVSRGGKRYAQYRMGQE